MIQLTVRAFGLQSNKKMFLGNENKCSIFSLIFISPIFIDGILIAEKYEDEVVPALVNLYLNATNLLKRNLRK